VGYVKDEDLAKFYNAADIYVMPNSEERGDIEGFGMVFLEANACGKPVIAGRSGGAAEAVVHGKTGLLIDPNDAIELEDAIRLLCQDRIRAIELGSNGRRRALADFNWESRALQLDRINRSIVDAVHAGEAMRR
jgi:phosphatidylinositol alpha-1,6-mannosyltransferase